jgi:hypothetical protein
MRPRLTSLFPLKNILQGVRRMCVHVFTWGASIVYDVL